MKTSTPAATITFTFGQMGALVSVLVAAVGGAAGWASAVDERLENIEKTTAAIESRLERLQTVQAEHEKRIQSTEDRCCKQPIGWYWRYPAIMPDNRRRVQFNVRYPSLLA